MIHHVRCFLSARVVPFTLLGILSGVILVATGLWPLQVIGVSLIFVVFSGPFWAVHPMDMQEVCGDRRRR